LLVTHNVLEAERVVDRVALINSGRVVAEGTPGELKARLGEAIRLELWLRDGTALSAMQRASLAEMGLLRQPRPHQLMLLVPQERAGSIIDQVLTQISPAAVEDFRLATASLEDVYIELVGRPIEDGRANVQGATDGAEAIAGAREDE